MGVTARDVAVHAGVSLADLVPADHVSRRLQAMLDLAVARDLVREDDQGGGRPRIDPVVVFTPPLILCVEGRRSERHRLAVGDDRFSLGSKELWNRKSE